MAPSRPRHLLRSAALLALSTTLCACHFTPFEKVVETPIPYASAAQGLTLRVNERVVVQLGSVNPSVGTWLVERDDGAPIVSATTRMRSKKNPAPGSPTEVSIVITGLREGTGKLEYVRCWRAYPEDACRTAPPEAFATGGQYPEASYFSIPLTVLPKK